MRAGGGGIYRACVSLTAKTVKREDGSADFARINAEWRVEKSKESSPILDQCRVEGARATKAFRQAFDARVGHSRRGVSSFGAVSANAKRKGAAAASATAAVEAFETHAQAHADRGEATARGSCCDMSAGVQLTCASLDAQLKALRSMHAHRARAAALKGRQEEKALSDSLAKGLPELQLGPDPASWLGLGTFGAARTGSIISVHPQLECMQFSARRVAQMCSRKSSPSLGSAASHLQRAWEAEHAMTTDASCDRIRDVPGGYRRPQCWDKGYGSCICRGRGEIVNLARRRLANVLAAACPKKPRCARGFKKVGWWFNSAQAFSCTWRFATSNP